MALLFRAWLGQGRCGGRRLNGICAPGLRLPGAISRKAVRHEDGHGRPGQRQTCVPRRTRRTGPAGEKLGEGNWAMAGWSAPPPTRATSQRGGDKLPGAQPRAYPGNSICERIEHRGNRHGAASKASLHVPTGQLLPVLLDAGVRDTNQHRDQMTVGQNQAAFLVRTRRVHEDWPALKHRQRLAWFRVAQTQIAHLAFDADQIAQFDLEVCHISQFGRPVPWAQPSRLMNPTSSRRGCSYQRLLVTVSRCPTRLAWHLQLRRA